ncbi:MAG: hypothetical protein IJC43_09955 [Clostridia bacterium]|nr:hypothetical protein [Clostridia bacterium]
MVNLIQRQTLTERQYRRANRVMCLILLVSYLVYIIVEVINARRDPGSDALLRSMVYGAAAAVSLGMCVVRPDKKATAVTMAVCYLAAYSLLIFGNGVVVLAMVFPVIIGFMIYLNSVLVGAGCLAMLVIGAIKCWQVRGDSVLFNYGIMIMAGYVVATVGAMSVIILLIRFSKEDRDVIEQAAAHRERVARTVAQIVSVLYNDFTGMVRDLETVNNAMRSADDAMNGIAGSSTDTADAVNNQAKMTSQIQRELEHTDRLAAEAGDTTGVLGSVVTEGRELADNLMQQSQLVDRDVTQISDVTKRLVNNVRRVTGITGAILDISSQTNLLALNASVEAARAGAAGRGFAVIAAQIRSMSTETEESTGEIEKILKELTSLTGETQKAVTGAAENIAAQRQQINAVNESFERIQQGMAALEKSIGIMGDNVKSVLVANGEIVDSISLLSAASEEVSAGTQQCRQTTGTAFENLGRFSKKVEGAFGQLQQLRETAGG